MSSKLTADQVLSNNHILGKLNEHGLASVVRAAMEEYASQSPGYGLREADLVTAFVDFVTDNGATFISSIHGAFWYVQGRKDTPSKEDFIKEFFQSERYTALSLTQEEDGWVKVDKDAPEPGQIVFVCEDGSQLYEAFQWCPRGFNGNSEPYFVGKKSKQVIASYEITHWRPLPPAPQTVNK